MLYLFSGEHSEAMQRDGDHSQGSRISRLPLEHEFFLFVFLNAVQFVATR